MLNFFEKKYFKDETALIFSIESGEITSTLVQYKRDQKPLVLYSKIHVLNFSKEIDKHFFQTHMLLALKRAVEDVLILGFKEISDLHRKSLIQNIHVFLGAPWYNAFTKEKNIVKEKPFTITHEIIDEAAEELFSEVGDSGVHVEKKVISVRANGYEINNPIGHKVSSALITAYIAISAEDLVQNIKEMIFLSFPNFEIHFHTICIAMYSIVTRLMPNSDFILMLPEHQVTEFVLVSKKSIGASVSVPFGRHHLIEALAKENDGSILEAHSLLKSWTENKLTKAKEDATVTILQNSKEEWFAYLRNALNSLSKFSLLPQTIIVSGKTLESKILSEWILKEDYSNQTFTLNKFKVLFLTKVDVDTNLQFSSTVVGEKVSSLTSSLVLFLRSI